MSIKYRIYRINNDLEILNAAFDYKDKLGNYFDYIWEHEVKDKAYELNLEQKGKNNEVEFWYRAIEWVDLYTPKTIEPVLAQITALSISGQLTWYEVVYYDPEDNEWHFNGGSDTAENLGWIILKWKYCSEY